MMFGLLVAAWLGNCLALKNFSPTWKSVAFVENALEPFPRWSNLWAKLRGGVWLAGSDSTWQGGYSGLSILNASGDSVYLLALGENASIAELKVILSETGVLHVERMRQTFLLDPAGVTIKGQGYGTIFEAISVMGDELLLAIEPSHSNFDGVERYQSALVRYNLSGILRGEAKSNWAKEVVALGTCNKGNDAGVEGLIHLPGAGALAICEESGKAWFVARRKVSSRFGKPLELQIPPSLHQGMRVSGMVLLPHQGGTHVPSDNHFESLVLMTRWRGEISGHSSMQIAGLVFSNTGRGWQLQPHPTIASFQLDAADGYPIENVEGVALAEAAGQRRLLIISDSSNSRLNYGCERTVLLEFEVGHQLTDADTRGASFLQLNSKVAPISEHKPVPTPAPLPATMAAAAATTSDKRAVCGPQSLDGFSQARAGFWMPPPNSRLLGAAVFTRHGDRTALPGSESTCTRFMTATSPLRSLRRCAKNSPADDSHLHLDFISAKGPRTSPDADADLLSALLSGDALGTMAHDGQLTKLGTVQMQELGRLYGERYTKLALDMRNVTARSTPLNRTVMGAKAFFHGLLRSAPRLVPASALQLRVDARLSETFGPLRDVPLVSVSNNTRSDISARIERKHARLLRRLRQKGDLPPMDVRELQGYLLDCLQVSFCWGKMWAWPHQFQEISVMQELQNMRLEEHKEVYQLQQPSGATLAEVMTRAVLREALSRIAQGGFHFYSGHDVTLLPLFSALKLANFAWPPLASHLTLELYEVDGSQRVAVLLNGQLQSPQRCHEEFCRVEELLTSSAVCSAGAMMTALLVACVQLVV